ncbi:hypothetical protein D5S18_15500 [Nocardia panacis]|uniref:Uncharacterized protein n=1 Tax=Nocardia panacis TaxID=2340916 RepID=A0A3A4KNZ9_9NOCA|nr:hypothetical protein D5S18_15500 [Nocardia panacis]
MVTVSSTWGPGSLLWRHPDLIGRLLSELTADDHVVAAVVHPNVWFAHSPLQLRMWLADALRCGLRLIPPTRGWQQTVLAADLVIGDHGAVTSYAAALGVPTLLASFPPEEVAAGSAVDLLGRIAPRLNPERPLPEQISAALHDPPALTGIADSATSKPNECAIALRTAIYQLMDLSEPDTPPPVFPYAAADLVPERQPVLSCRIACQWTDTTAVIRRWPADISARHGRGARIEDTYLAIDRRHPRRDLGSVADIVAVSNHALAETLRQRPACTATVAELDAQRIHIHHRSGLRIEAHLSEPIAGPLGSAAVAAAAHDWMGRSGHRYLPPTAALFTGTQRIHLRFKQIES